MNNYSYKSMRDTFDMSAYFVVGPQDCKGRPITGVVEDALRGGATFIQLRAKIPMRKISPAWHAISHRLSNTTANPIPWRS